MSKFQKADELLVALYKDVTFENAVALINELNTFDAITDAPSVCAHAAVALRISRVKEMIMVQPEWFDFSGRFKHYVHGTINEKELTTLTNELQEQLFGDSFKKQFTNP